MEISNIAEKRGLKARFAFLYVLSVAIIVFIAILFAPRLFPAGIGTATTTVESSEAGENDVLVKIEGLNTQYKKLKQLDQEYSVKIIDSVNANDLIILDRSIKESENILTRKIDSLETIAATYSNQDAANVLRSFAQSFKMVVNDRASMQAFKTAVMAKGSGNTNQQAMLTMQSEIQARNNQIAALEGQVSLLQNRSNTNRPVANTPSTNNSAAAQQTIDALRLTISDQDRKIAALTAANANLEKENRNAGNALEEARKLPVDNTSATLKTQTAALEKRVNDLNAELRFAQVDCNISRVDATQIISNARQRKLLLADALTTLNTLSVNGDVAVKKKAAEKMARLNQVASMVRD